MYTRLTIALIGTLLLTSVYGWIQLEQHDEDKVLSRTTTELLSSLNQCIVFIFDWEVKTKYSDPLTSTNYFIFYFKSISCAIIAETWMHHRKKRVMNPQFANYYHPHPLFTKYTTTLINMYSPAATGSARDYKNPDSRFIPFVIRKYNIPFNYVLLFMTNQVFSSLNMKNLLSECADVSAPAVYLLILDARQVNVVGFAHVLQYAPYLFRVNKFQKSHMQRLHKMTHKDLQRSEAHIITSWTLRTCGFGPKLWMPPHNCAISALMEFYNMTFCNSLVSLCPRYSLSQMKISADLNTQGRYTRRSAIYYEFNNYLVDKMEFSFNCFVETGPMGFIAFVQAFDLPSWIIVATVCTCLTIAVACLSAKTAVSFPTKLLSSAVVVIMLLLDRFYASNNSNEKAGLERAASRQAAVLLITLWAFGAMLLGLSYSGKMVSELTAPSIPPTPHNMHELALTDYPVLTHQLKLFKKNGQTRTEPEFQFRIKDYLAKYHDRNPGLTHDLRRVSKGTTVVGSGGHLVYQPSGRKSSSVLFAYADLSRNMKAYHIWAIWASTRLRALTGGKLPFFDTRFQMTVQSNSLLPIFRRFLATIRELGLLTYWEDIARAETIYLYISKSVLSTQQLSMGSKATLGQADTRQLNVATIWIHCYGK